MSIYLCARGLTAARPAVPAGGPGGRRKIVYQSGRIGGEPCEVGPGDALIVPPGVLFGLSNDGDESAQVVVCTSAGVRASLNGRTVVPPWSE